MANLECNAVCGVAITHHFLAKMVRICLTHGRSRPAAVPAEAATLTDAPLLARHRPLRACLCVLGPQFYASIGCVQAP